MKNKMKFLAILLAVLTTVLCLPINALASDMSEPEEASEAYESITSEIPNDTETEEASQNESFAESASTSVEMSVETETMIFEFTEKDRIDGTITNNSQVQLNGSGVVTTNSTQITSSSVPEGVYSLQNVGNVGLWMDIQGNKTDPGYHVQQYAYAANPAETFKRQGLFKISLHPKYSGKYIIRLMLNNALSFGFLGTEVITKKIPTIDFEVAEADTFTITYSSGGYIIKPYGSSYAISANNTTASGAGGAPDSYLTKRTSTEAGTRAKWQLYQYTGAHKNGTILYYTSSWNSVGIPVGTTGTMSCKTWSTHIGANTPYKRVAADSSAMISTSYDFTTGKMSFEALSPGKAKIYSMILEGNSEPSKYTVYSYFQVIPQEGTYLIKNNKTSRYIDIKGPNKNEGTLLHQWTYSTKEYRRWMVEHISGSEGYVRIKSAYSNKYIGVDSSDNTIIKQTSTLDDYTLWKFERTSAGNIRLVCKALGSATVLTLPSDENNNGTNLTTNSYTDDSEYNDEWTIYFVQYSYTLHHYYDYGFNARFTDTDSTALEKLKVYHNEVSERLMQIFGVVTYGDYFLFESSADLCKKMMYGEDDYLDYIEIEENCTHGENSSNIHLTRTDLQEGLSYSNILTPVVWTGYIMPGPKTSITVNKRSIVMTPYYTTKKNSNSEYVNLSDWNEVKWNSIYSFIHEVGHTLGAPDHYCYDSKNRPCDNKYCDVCVYNIAKRECLMSCYPRKNINEISNEDLFCQDCLQTIRTHLEDHH